MSIRQAIFEFLQLFSAFSFFAFGLFCIGLYFTDHLRFAIADHLIHQPLICLKVGGYSFAIFLSFALFSYLLHRRKSFLVKMGHFRTEIDLKVLEQSIKPLFDKHFQSKMVLESIYLSRMQKLEIGVQVRAEEKQMPQLLSEAENHLEKLLAQRFGKKEPFTLRVEVF